MDRVKVKSCVSTVIFDFWGKAAAKAWLSGNCENDKCAFHTVPVCWMQA